MKVEFGKVICIEDSYQQDKKVFEKGKTYQVEKRGIQDEMPLVAYVFKDNEKHFLLPEDYFNNFKEVK